MAKPLDILGTLQVGSRDADEGLKEWVLVVGVGVTRFESASVVLPSDTPQAHAVQALIQKAYASALARSGIS